MAEFQYLRSEDGGEVAVDFGTILADLDGNSRRILWQALTIDVLGKELAGVNDLLHVMFTQREDGQYQAQVDRQTPAGGRVEHLQWWHGVVEEDGRRGMWRIVQ